MMRVSLMASLAATLLCSTSAQAEILAMANYESKAPEALKAFKRPVAGQTRQEGIAEPHRVCRRLLLLRGWSHDEANTPLFA